MGLYVNKNKYLLNKIKKSVNKKVLTGKCDICGKSFETYQTRRKYCGQYCNEKSYYKRHPEMLIKKMERNVSRTRKWYIKNKKYAYKKSREWQKKQGIHWFRDYMREWRKRKLSI